MNNKRRYQTAFLKKDALLAWINIFLRLNGFLTIVYIVCSRSLLTFGQRDLNIYIKMPSLIINAKEKRETVSIKVKCNCVQS